MSVGTPLQIIHVGGYTAFLSYILGSRRFGDLGFCRRRSLLVKKAERRGRPAAFRSRQEQIGFCQRLKKTHGLRGWNLGHTRVIAESLAAPSRFDTISEQKRAPRRSQRAHSLPLNRTFGRNGV